MARMGSYIEVDVVCYMCVCVPVRCAVRLRVSVSAILLIVSSYGEP